MANEDGFTSRTFDEDYRQFEPRNQYLGDDKIPVEFFIMAKRDEEATIKNGGVPVYRDVEQIKIMVNKDEIHVEDVTEIDKRRWPRQYASWKASGHNAPGMYGTPLDRMIGITPSQVATLKHLQVYSVERFAEAPDQILMGTPGMIALREKARDQMRIAKEEAPAAAAAAMMEKMRAMEETMARVNEIVAENAELKSRLAAREEMTSAPVPRAKRKLKRKYTKRTFDSPQST